MLCSYCKAARSVVLTSINQLRLWPYRLRRCSTFISLIHNSDVTKYLSGIEKEYSGLREGDVFRYKELTPIMNFINERRRIQEEIDSLESLLLENDPDLKKMAENEKVEYLKKLDGLNEGLMRLLMDSNDEGRDVILEVTAGAGGKEAMLFAAELFQMYGQYAMYKKWDFTPDTIDSSEGGGVRHSSAFVSGPWVLSCLLQEVGVHRVQRVPATEKSGRIHTSTVAVSVLIQPTEVEVHLPDKDVKIETKTSCGPGGQHVNKTETCVRITHLPTGVVVENQTERSQILNRKLALKRLRTKLYQMQWESQVSEFIAAKKEQVGTRERSEKIRTYNFNQDRITDHRLGRTLHNLEGFLHGGAPLDEMVTDLRREKQRKDFLQFVSQYNQQHAGK